MSRASVILTSVFLVAAAASCSDDDTGGSTSALTFKATQDALPNYSFDTGYLPSGSPAQVKLELKSGGGITVEAKASASGDALTPVAGTGKVTMAVQLKFGVKLKVNVTGIKYDGPLKNAPDINIKFGGTTTFDPFLIGKKVTLNATVPETKLATIPLGAALGLPGVTGDLELKVSGKMKSDYSGVCAKASGGAAQYTGKTVTSGDLKIKATLKLKALMYNKTVGPFDIPVTIPAIPANIDLGTKSLSGGASPKVGPCAGGTTGDGGVGDGGVKPTEAGGKTEAGTGGDAGSGPGKCNPSSGQPKGAMCKLSSDCKCPAICVKMFSSPGSCWTQCDPAKTNKTTKINPACDNTGTGERCWGYGCLGLGTVSGSFTAPVFTYPNTPTSSADLGAATVTVTIPGVGTKQFDYAYGTTIAGSPTYSHAIIFMPLDSSGTSLDQTKELRIFITKKASYKAGAVLDLAKTDQVEVRYKEYVIDSSSSKVTKDQLRGLAWSGAVSFTKAGTGAKAPATGTITGKMVRYESTFCGPGTTACK